MSVCTRTVLVDDHPVFRHGLRQAIERDASFEVVGEAEDGVFGFELMQRVRTDIAVLDISLPRLSGLCLARRMTERRMPAKVVILTMHKEADMVNSAMNLGVRGYLLKDNSATEILACL